MSSQGAPRRQFYRSWAIYMTSWRVAHSLIGSIRLNHTRSFLNALRRILMFNEHKPCWQEGIRLRYWTVSQVCLMARYLDHSVLVYFSTGTNYIQSFGARHHVYADDLSLLTVIRGEQSSLANLESLTFAIKDWYKKKDSCWMQRIRTCCRWAQGLSWPSLVPVSLWMSLTLRWHASQG